MFRFQDLSLVKKLSLAVFILLMPLGLMGYFLIAEKNVLIEFTQQEIEGVNYLSALQKGFIAATAASPDKATLEQVADAIQKAEDADQGRLGITKTAKGAMVALTSGKSRVNTVAKVAEAIGGASDASNITLDPDTDSYFIGDMLVNQGENIVQRAIDLLIAAQNLSAQSNQEDLMAFAIARDGFTAVVASFTTDYAKAVKGNADGALDKNLADAVRAVTTQADALTGAATTNDYAKVVAQAPATMAAVSSAFVKLDEEMLRLLNARIVGFHKTVLTHLGLSALFALIGAFITFYIVRSITRPVACIIAAMGSIGAGRLDIDLPREDRHDEIGQLLLATEAFHDAARKAEQAKQIEKANNEREAARAAELVKLNAVFSESVKEALATLDHSIKTVDGLAVTIAADAESSAEQAQTIAAGAQEAAASVETVAAASEELSASIDEISARVNEAGAITAKATHEAAHARQMVGGLSEATTKIGEVIGLITDIANQTNLLALNATIEAARAGEAGKGFAVVASEVKTLANQTAHATEGITGHINAIEHSVKDVIAAINIIETTIGQVNSVSSSIASAITEQGAATQEIARNVQEAATGTSEVTASITRVAKMIEQTKNASQEVLESVKRVESEASTLGEDIGMYISNVSKV